MRIDALFFVFSLRRSCLERVFRPTTLSFSRQTFIRKFSPPPPLILKFVAQRLAFCSLPLGIQFWCILRSHSLLHHGFRQREKGPTKPVGFGMHPNRPVHIHNGALSSLGSEEIFLGVVIVISLTAYWSCRSLSSTHLIGAQCSSRILQLLQAAEAIASNKLAGPAPTVRSQWERAA